ncbi:MAG: ATP-binding cassette domain-containing protein [Deltaproteobacteria bacterium]|nr:ATP-binding cassette domain-containing protein [Deltaproteobacteria bacterium]
MRTRAGRGTLGAVEPTSPVPLLEMQGLTWRFALASRLALGPIDLELGAGEVVLLTGPTGSGKSTLLRLAAGILGRHGHGTVGGAIRVEGRDPASLAPSERVMLVGFVAQEPADQVVTGTLGDEVAFGPESAGWPPDRIEARIHEMLETFGLPREPERSPATLSGGQQQRLLIAASLSARARLLLLDEPLAQLDPGGAREVVAHLAALAARGVGVVVAEHRLEACWSACGRVVVLDNGRIASDTPREAAPLSLLRELGLALPGMVDLADRLAGLGLAPADLAVHLPRSQDPPAEPRPPGPPVLAARDLVRARNGRTVAGLPALDLAPGERVALLGANGAGKTSLIESLAGEGDGGRITTTGRVLVVPQDPDLSLFCETVRAELAYGPREAGLEEEAVNHRVGEAARALSLEDLLERPPQALSRGQRLRVAVAAALACRPAVLLLDEPTSGQDRDRVDRMMEALAEALVHGALVFATHDVDLALRHATRVLLVEEGTVVQDGTPVRVAGALRTQGLLPPLAALCLDLGFRPQPAADLAARVS